MNSELVKVVEQYDNDTGNFSDNLNCMSVEDIRLVYGWDEDTSLKLYLIVQGTTNPSYSMYSLPDNRVNQLVENIKESIHQSFDGWSVEDQVVIRAYLSDLAYSTQV